MRRLLVRLALYLALVILPVEDKCFQEILLLDDSADSRYDTLRGLQHDSTTLHLLCVSS